AIYSACALSFASPLLSHPSLFPYTTLFRSGGFSAAARVLGHPKSSLSAAVQRLEANLGLRLIERTTRHLRLTDSGETIYRKVRPDRKSTRLNSSHVKISYAVFCLKKKKNKY